MARHKPKKYCAIFGRNVASCSVTIFSSSEFLASFGLSKVQCFALAPIQPESRRERERRKATRCLVKIENGVARYVRHFLCWLGTAFFHLRPAF